jgi:hypothetical protein
LHPAVRPQILTVMPVCKAQVPEGSDGDSDNFEVRVGVTELGAQLQRGVRGVGCGEGLDVMTTGQNIIGDDCIGMHEAPHRIPASLNE